MRTSDRYRMFGEREARGESASYERLALAIADDAELLGLLDELPEPKRQPNLLFAAVRYLGGPVEEPTEFREWVPAHWRDVAATMTRRRTQTNEPGRCAVLLPVLAQLPQPLALIEVGASAGLCLYPDAYRYRYGRHTVGPADSAVQLDCTIEGPVPLPDRPPTVVWRAGLDLNPLDMGNHDDLRWLEALIWPEQHHRRERLHAAAAIVRADPPRLVRGDLLSDLPAVVAQAPPDTTVVVLHSAALAYVPVETRSAFVNVVESLPVRWISNEGTGVLPHLAGAAVARPNTSATFLLTLDGRPLALAGPHGQTLRWLNTGDRRS